MVLVVSPILVTSLSTIVLDMQRFAIVAIQQTKDANRERKRAENLIFKMLPKEVGRALKKNEIVPAERFSEATVFFSHIAKFNDIIAVTSPIDVIHLLNTLYMR